MTEIKETPSCNNCEKCIVCGWRPGRDAHRISYYCDEDDRHVSPGDCCPFHEPGDPWKRIREEEMRYEREHHPER